MPCRDYYDNSNVEYRSYDDSDLKKRVGILEEDLCNLRGFLVALVSESDINIKDVNIKRDFTVFMEKVRHDQIEHRKRDLLIAISLMKREAEGLKEQINQLQRSNQLISPVLVDKYNSKLNAIRELESINTDEELLSKKNF